MHRPESGVHRAAHRVEVNSTLVSTRRWRVEHFGIHCTAGAAPVRIGVRHTPRPPHPGARTEARVRAPVAPGARTTSSVRAPSAPPARAGAHRPAVDAARPPDPPSNPFRVTCHTCAGPILHIRDFGRTADKGLCDMGTRLAPAPLGGGIARHPERAARRDTRQVRTVRAPTPPPRTGCAPPHRVRPTAPAMRTGCAHHRPESGRHRAEWTPLGGATAPDARTEWTPLDARHRPGVHDIAVGECTASDVHRRGRAGASFLDRVRYVRHPARTGQRPGKEMSPFPGRCPGFCSAQAVACPYPAPMLPRMSARNWWTWSTSCMHSIRNTAAM